MNIPITCASSLLWRYYRASKQLSASNYLLIAPEMTELHLCDSQAPGWSHKNACQFTQCPTDRLVAVDWVDQMFWHPSNQIQKNVLDGVVTWYEGQQPRAPGEVHLFFLFFFSCLWIAHSWILVFNSKQFFLACRGQETSRDVSKHTLKFLHNWEELPVSWPSPGRGLQVASARPPPRGQDKVILFPC